MSSILYKNIRNFIKPWKSKKYLDWVHAKFPSKEIHHLIGSVGNLKLSDLLILPVSRLLHQEAHKDASTFFEDNLVHSLNLVAQYISALEDRIESLEASIKAPRNEDNLKGV